MTRHTFEMNDSFDDARDGTPHETRVEMNFETEFLDEIVQEFTSYLQHCGYTYVESVEVHTRLSLERRELEKVKI